ncbi:hypothetical protein AAF712_009924 [Marasmius tenuissimus]|uniref:Uncharacterized protein n=1 Tax=Marasmius tenuissimus TaxID=585030 RepID=A0ABR2ZQ87_9AGAR
MDILRDDRKDTLLRVSMHPLQRLPSENNGPTPLQRGPLGGKNLGEVFSDFAPIAPEIYCRYKEDFIEPELTGYKLAPRTTNFRQKRAYRMAGGSSSTQKAHAYFVYEAKKIYTEANIHDPDILRHVKRLIAEFDEYIEKQNVTLPG